MHVLPELEKLRQEHYYEFGNCLSYIVSSIERAKDENFKKKLGQ